MANAENACSGRSGTPPLVGTACRAGLMPDIVSVYSCSYPKGHLVDSGGEGAPTIFLGFKSKRIELGARSADEPSLPRQRKPTEERGVNPTE